MDIIPFEEKYRDTFIAFNTDWIVRYFGALEQPDYEEFAKIDTYLAQGGNIFIAVDGDEPLAVCMVIPLEPGVWEICKLGSTNTRPHKGAGTAVFEACMDWAIQHGAKSIRIITNSQLSTALHIYRSHGFREVSPEGCGYVRGDLAFEYIVPDIL